MPVVLQPIRLQRFLYDGSFLVSTDSAITAIQLYADSDDVMEFAHVFHIPLPDAYLSSGPLASDAAYIFMVAHPSNRSNNNDVVVYNVSDGSMVCIQPIKLESLGTGMTVTKLRDSVYEATLIQDSAKKLTMYELDLEEC